ncbi:MAG TPA: hypothetical protein VH598_06010, partial [Verrucomicrobiae bacterium]|nr:hypothetical protein [Verrucomicrobiae bacterium]
MTCKKTTMPECGGRISRVAMVAAAIFALASAGALAAAEKPWGELEYKSISLEPEELFLDGAKPPESSRWFFQSFSRAKLFEFLNSCELTETQKAALLR